MRTIKCQSSELLNFKKKGTAKWTPFSGLEIPAAKRATANISVLCSIHSLGKLHLAVTSENLEMVLKAIKQERENCLDIFQPISQNIIKVQLSPQTPKKPGTPPTPQKKKNLSFWLFWNPDYGCHDSPRETESVLSLGEGKKVKGMNQDLNLPSLG